tara:strand:+ start:2607 stop:3422 length:816 start_codon:yes stop_codon:yes gene_type:complete
MCLAIPAGTDIHRVIRAYNLSLFLMYYDEVIDKPTYQLTFFQQADRPYYNAVHALSDKSEMTILEIENFFQARNISPSFYLDPQSPRALQKILMERGYQLLKSEEESWYHYDLLFQGNKLEEKKYLKRPESNVRIVEVDLINEDEITDFVHVDQLCNELPDSVTECLTYNIKNKVLSAVQNHYFIAYVDEKPVATSALGIVGDRAFLSEGATLPEFRRQGLYSSLIKKCLLFAKERKCREAFINCDFEANSNKTAKEMNFIFLFKRDFYRA